MRVKYNSLDCRPKTGRSVTGKTPRRRLAAMWRLTWLDAAIRSIVLSLTGLVTPRLAGALWLPLAVSRLPSPVQVARMRPRRARGQEL
jgi:hypothetical protein